MTRIDLALLGFAAILAALLVFRAPPPESRELLSTIVGGLFALARNHGDRS